MEAVFIKLVNMSITASYLAIAVILFRLLLKKAPRWIFVTLWAMVGLRLLLPFSLESVFSLIPETEPLPYAIVTDPVPQINSGFPTINSAVNPLLGTAMAAPEGASVNPMQIAIFAASVIWMVGMAAMALYTLISYLRLRYQVRESVNVQGNIYDCDHISSPFILGLFSPRIYLPTNLDEGDIPYVIAHEKAHLSRLDHIWKPLGFFLLTLYWFNPILWVAYILLCRDIESACDERVLKTDGTHIKKAYCEALINCSVHRRSIAACPLAFGETGVKRRIKNVLNYKKPAFWIILVALIVSLTVGVCLLTDPIDTELPAQLEFSICNWIKDAHKTADTEDHYATVNYEIIGKQTSKQGITVYLWVLYEEYSYDGVLRLESGSHILTAITAQKQEGNHYRLVEYWNPEDGARYTASIREKLPWYLHRKGLDSQHSTQRLQALSRSKAEAYFEVQMLPSSVIDSQPPVSEYTEASQASPFLGLDASRGLTVCIWQMAEHSYRCALLPDKNASFSSSQFTNTPGVSLEEMAKILSGYELPDQEIRLCIVQNPFSSYVGRADDAFIAEIRKHLGLGEITWDNAKIGARDIDFSFATASTSWVDVSRFLGAAGADYFPSFYFSNAEKLSAFLENGAATFDINRSEYGYPSLQELLRDYDADYFQNHHLLMIYVPIPSSAHRPRVSQVTYYDNNTFTVTLDIPAFEAGDSVVMGRFLLIRLSTRDVASCWKYNVQLSPDSQ